MKKLTALSIFSEIGKTKWSLRNDAFVFETRFGASLFLSPNYEEKAPTHVHFDEIFVPLFRRRKGVATQAIADLCRLANKYNFRIYGGPIGWSESAWGDKFADWLQGYGFKPDLSEVVVDKVNTTAFFVERLPCNQAPHCCSKT